MLLLAKRPHRVGRAGRRSGPRQRPRRGPRVALALQCGVGSGTRRRRLGRRTTVRGWAWPGSQRLANQRQGAWLGAVNQEILGSYSSVRRFRPSSTTEAIRDRQCALNHDATESAPIVSGVINKPTKSSCVGLYHLYADDLLWRNYLSPQCRNCSRDPDHAHLGSSSSQD